VSDELTQFVGGFVDELNSSGVRHVSLAPGSRSTPLALLFRRHSDVRVWTHLDERSAAFFTLGMAKSLREPVAILSTSGTAAVNFAPAVVEAYYARVPLIVLTADRPPELRGVGANQTVDQVDLYGSHVKWSMDMKLPDSSAEALRDVRATAARAVASARAAAPGPVHINFPFREPLIPADIPAVERNGSDMQETKSIARVEDLAHQPDPESISALADELDDMKRGLIVCGPQDDPGFADAVARLADELDFPILADALSQVRCGPHHTPRVIDAYDAFLRDEELSKSLVPDIILRFGAAPTSKPLLQYLERHGASRQVLIDNADAWRDPTSTADQRILSDSRPFCEALSDALRAPERAQAREATDWTLRWQDLNQNTRAALTSRLKSDDACSEPGVFRELAQQLPDGATLFAGNSMPVRDLDTFFGGSERPIRFMANRGASGIDGVVSSALGASVASDEPLVLVIGDLSFYHDMNGLLAAERYDLNATIILVNNDGGGIFSFLPQAENGEHFEELFGTPHGLDFQHAAKMYDLDYRVVASAEQLGDAVNESITKSGVQVIEVQTDRQANVILHQELWSDVSSAMRTPAPS
jgi:2-succinyl-5-enolpyruvyl-6-hydroxy-3-cyclohexene-1-carboxylate synthase